MTTAQDGCPQPELIETIRHQIVHRACVRGRTLEVEGIGTRLVVRGVVSSYYLKQLVLQAVLDVIGAVDAGGFEFNVQVADSPRESVKCGNQ